jgi:(S)-2-hydroxyglutarate dehydrogenase
MKHPYVVGGGGIVGCAIAREIRKRDLGDVIVLEKEKDVGMHASSRNSGVRHSGINQKPGSKKGEMCVRGSRMLREYCEEKGVRNRGGGTIVVSENGNDHGRLVELENWAKAVGVPGVRLIDEAELNEREPNVKGICGLYSPTGAIVDSNALVKSIAEDAKDLGAEFYFGNKVEVVTPSIIFTNNESFDYGHLINCAGAYADKVAEMCGVNSGLRVVPILGKYFEVNAEINSMVYPVPDVRYPFLGVHLTRTIDDKVIAGPSASFSWRGRERYDGGFDKDELLDTIFSINFASMAGRMMTKDWKLFYESRLGHSKLMFACAVGDLLKEEVDLDEIKPYSAGIRAQMVDRKGKFVNDYVIEKGENSTHILNAVSPCMTSSLAFAEFVVDNYLNDRFL